MKRALLLIFILGIVSLLLFIDAAKKPVTASQKNCSTMLSLS